MFTPHEPPPRARDIGRIPFPRLTPWADPVTQRSLQLSTPSPLQVSTPVTPGQPAHPGARQSFRPLRAFRKNLRCTERAPSAAVRLHACHLPTAHACRGRCQGGSPRVHAANDDAHGLMVVEEPWADFPRPQESQPNTWQPAQA